MGLGKPLLPLCGLFDLVQAKQIGAAHQGGAALVRAEPDADRVGAFVGGWDGAATHGSSVLLLRDGLNGIHPLQIWAAFGLGAVPSCFLWHSLRERLGTRRALALNLGLQAIGVASAGRSTT
mgnify:CR=1 FL=1